MRIWTLSLLLTSGLVRAGFAFFRKMGALGIFLLGVCDSSFLFIPFSNDLLLVALVSSRRSSLQWIVYTLAASLGSVVGVIILDLVMRKLGKEGLERFVGANRLDKIKEKIEKRGIAAVFLATLMPPPFPFTAVIATTSALQMERLHILIAVFAGRMVRFTAESILALYLGRRLLRYLKSEYVEYFVYGFIVIAIVGTSLTIRKWLRARPQQLAQVDSTAS